MESDVAPKDRSLKSFTYWSVEVASEDDRYGQVAIRCFRQEVRRTGELEDGERRELFDVIIPRVERMAAAIYGHSRGSYQWKREVFWFIPERVDRTRHHFYEEYHRVFNSAA